MPRSIFTVVAVQALLGTATFLTGSAIFFGWVSGLKGVLMSPLLSVFGWYFWFPAYALVSVSWGLYRPSKWRWAQRLVFIGIASVAGYLVSTAVLWLLGAKDQSLAEAFCFASTGSGAMASCLVMVFKQERRDTHEVGAES